MDPVFLNLLKSYPLLSTFNSVTGWLNRDVTEQLRMLALKNIPIRLHTLLSLKNDDIYNTKTSHHIINDHSSSSSSSIRDSKKPSYLRSHANKGRLLIMKDRDNYCHDDNKNNFNKDENTNEDHDHNVEVVDYDNYDDDSDEDKSYMTNTIKNTFFSIKQYNLQYSINNYYNYEDIKLNLSHYDNKYILSYCSSDGIPIGSALCWLGQYMMYVNEVIINNNINTTTTNINTTTTITPTLNTATAAITTTSTITTTTAGYDSISNYGKSNDDKVSNDCINSNNTQLSFPSSASSSSSQKLSLTATTITNNYIKSKTKISKKNNNGLNNNSATSVVKDNNVTSLITNVKNAEAFQILGDDSDIDDYDDSDNNDYDD